VVYTLTQTWHGVEAGGRRFLEQHLLPGCERSREHTWPDIAFYLNLHSEDFMALKPWIFF
jgi:hypothetical protein